MPTFEQVESLIQACLGNAEKLLEAAKAVSKPGSNHIAYHLTVLALEEIGKSSLLFVESIRMVPPAPPDGEPRRSPLDWIEDHERKIFWAIWLPDFGHDLDWRTIPKHMELAKHIHEERLRALYFDPRDPGAQIDFTDDIATSLIKFAEVRLNMEQAKIYRELNDEQKSNLQWFFLATDSEQLKPFIFSKGSMEKQIEFKDDREGWLKWLRKTIEDSQQAAIDLTNQEMQRVRPDGEEGFEDKWLFKIRLKSWSHSIRPNQLTQWNEKVAKIKLFHTDDKSELIVQFTMPKSITMQTIWGAGMHNCVVFVSALNIATNGFFWWYLPTFVSKFYETLTDVESGGTVEIERVPALKIGWPHQALKDDVLQKQMMVVYGFIAGAREKEFAVFHKYFGVLGLMAKNDMFFQFEYNLVVNFSECFEMAMNTYGDWDGKPDTFDAAVNAYYGKLPDSEKFIEMVTEVRNFADQVRRQQVAEQITLEHVAKAKVLFDTYIMLKAFAHLREEVVSGRLKAEDELERPQPQ